MNLFLYNTLTRRKEEFHPIVPNKVSMYHCGPTVYDFAHIGNFRAYLLADLLRRTFEYFGFQVKQVMNITDVEDKTIKKSCEENTTLAELTRRYENIFLADLSALNILRPELTRATDNISEIIYLIGTLLEKGFAYKSNDGVYFSIDKSKNYGDLAKLSIGAQTRSRIKSDEYDKENPQDFALWKFHTEEDGDVEWSAPFGSGRPGWHIECSAMSMRILGENFDIHTGGIDLIFPHHTNEIAQSEAATGKKFVNYWIHNNFVLIDGQKMSKSLGNLVVLKDILSRGIAPVAFRYLMLSAHYRTLVNFMGESLEGAANALDRLKAMLADMPESGTVDLAYKAEFDRFIGDDLDTPKAIALMWDLLRDPEVLPADKKATILIFDKVFGLALDKAEPIAVPDDVRILAERRERARSDKNWKLADELRQKIEDMGFVVSDTETGFKIGKK